MRANRKVNPLPRGSRAIADDAPIGTPVRYYPTAGFNEFRETRTRSETWRLGHGELVVMIEGTSGGVCVSHCASIED